MGETETDTRLGDTPGNTSTIEFDRHPERLEKIKGSGGRRGLAIAMLDHPGPRAGRNETRHRRDIERVESPRGRTTCAHDVDWVRTNRQLDGRSAFHHGPDQTSDLGDGLALHPQRHDEGGDLGVGCGSAQDLA